MNAVSRRVRWLFGTGDITTSAPLAIVAFFQFFFLTDVARISPAHAAFAVAIGKVWDAINDPVVGILADRISSRHGRRRVLLLAGAIPIGMSFFLMWIVPPLGEAGLVAYYAIAYILFDTCFTVVGVAYNSLTPALTQDYDEQSSINGVRMVYSLGGSLGAIILGTILRQYIDDDRQLFFVLGIILSVIITVPPLIVARVCRDRDSVTGGEQPPTWEAIRHVLANKPFRIVMGVYLTSWTGVSLIAANLVYFAQYNLGVPDQASYFVLVAQGVGLFLIPAIVAIARRTDKRVAVYVGLGSMIPVLLAIALVPAEQYRIFYILAALLGLGVATAYVTPWSMIPDVIQWDAQRTGVRREASYYAIVSFFQKLGTAAALWIMGRVFEATGYVTPTDDAPVPVQPPEALAAVRSFLSIVPAALVLASILLVIYYPITRTVQKDIAADLKERGI